MTNKIIITAGEFSLAAELNDSPTARQILAVLPIEGIGNVWGEEIYFSIPIIAELEAGASEDVEIGALAYWPSGRAFCIFFGPTPVSIDEQPRAYSPVNVIGRLLDDATQLRSVANDTLIRITKSESDVT